MQIVKLGRQRHFSYLSSFASNAEKTDRKQKWLYFFLGGFLRTPPPPSLPFFFGTNGGEKSYGKTFCLLCLDSFGCLSKCGRFQFFSSFICHIRSLYFACCSQIILSETVATALIFSYAQPHYGQIILNACILQHYSCLRSRHERKPRRNCPGR